MPRVNIPIDGGFYLSDSLPISAQECTNWHVNIPQTSGALSQGTLFGCAGMSQVQTTGKIKQINRGAHVKSEKPYFLNGETLVRLDRVVNQGTEEFTIVELGTIPGEGRVSMADNGKQLMILVPGGNAYIVDETILPVFQQISDPDFYANGNPQIVKFVDSFFVCNTDEKKIIKSASNDGLSWNALDFGSAESDPDSISAVHVFNNKLFALGSEVNTEEFQNLGVGGFPFQRTGFFIDKGCYAPFSVVNANNTFMWIGGGENESPAIWALNGNSAQKVSTTAIDSALQDFSQEEIQQAFAYSYAQNGAYFVGFSLPTRTFEYNTVTSRWNERKSQIVNSKGLAETIRWRANSIVNAYNRILCGDSQDGRIGSVEVDTYTEYGSEIVRTFATQPLSDLGNVLTLPQLELTMESGVGDFETEDPQVRMFQSKNGKVFDENSLSRSIGKVGEFFKRAIWYRLGRFPRYAVFKFTMSDPVKPTVIKLEANVRGGPIGN